MKVNLNTVKCGDECKIGVWVRDSTQGIGTVTFYNPQTNRFAALGHPITDVDTRELMPAKDGYIASAKITDVAIGEKGTPGELSGDADYSDILGRVDKNTERGIYGTIESGGKKYFNSNKMRLANSSEVQTGEAYILSTIHGNEVKKYSINIESINKYSKDSTKNMTIEITDKELLKKTGGIVQGMSGSPIIQNGCLVGAVTHVFVNNPKKGYAVFAENMRE
jgi:stage IV sporulation protein B